MTFTVAEAKLLHNCAAGYVGRVAEGACVIFAIRQTETPDEPFYMLELNAKTRNVVQCRAKATGGGYSNQADATPEVQKFVDEWLSTKVNNLTLNIKSTQTKTMQAAV